MEGLRSTNWQLQNSHRDVKYSIGNIANDIFITRYGATWVLETSGPGALYKMYGYLTPMMYT